MEPKKTDKSLKSKAVKIQGKSYVLVSDRIVYFNEVYPNGGIMTFLVSAPESQTIIVKATVVPDWSNHDRVFTGYSQAVIGQGMVNKTAALENAETSAVGRALAMLGIGVIESIASVDEMAKAGVPVKSAPTAYVVPTAKPTLADAKLCPKCAKLHNGNYPKCLECFQKEKAADAANVPFI